MEQTQLSPDGLVRVEWQFSTGLMSHEINSPRFVDARTGEAFLSLWDEQWDASVRWEGEGRFAVSLRNYTRQGNVEAEVDLPAGTWRPISPPGDTQPLAGIDKSIRAVFARAAAEAQRASPPPPSQSGHSWDLVLGAAFAAVVGGAIYFFR